MEISVKATPVPRSLTLYTISPLQLMEGKPSPIWKESLIAGLWCGGKGGKIRHPPRLIWGICV